MGDAEVAGKAVGQTVGQQRQRNGRGVGRDHRAILADRLDLGIEVLLDVQALDDRLDDPVAIGQLAQVILDIAGGHQLGGALRHEGGGVGFEHLLHRAFGDGVAVGSVFRDDIQQQDGDAGIGHVGGDAGPHDSGADHGDFFDVRHQMASRTVAMP